METVLLILLVIGVAFNAVGVWGLLRFPDVYTRLHAETKTTTFGTIFICIAVILYGVDAYLGNPHDGAMLSLAAHAFVAMAVLAFTNATGSHAIARAAYRLGQKPAPALVDRLAEADEAGSKGEAKK